MDRVRRVRNRIAAVLVALVLPVLGFLGWNAATSNFGTVEPHRLYRSGQMPAGRLARTLKTHEIKTVLNLRGSHLESAWYVAEQRATLAHGATQIDMALASCEWMSRAQLKTLVHVLDTCERPLLIHCWHGSERTGWASALDMLLRPGGTLADARAQFSLRHLFVRAGDGRIMLEHLDEYAAWLDRERRTHSPETLRRWINEGYQPRRPGRDQWPYDPFPLVVITRPEPRDSSDGLGETRPQRHKEHKDSHKGKRQFLK